MVMLVVLVRWCLVTMVLTDFVGYDLFAMFVSFELGG